jgi:hypothetical protein
MLSRVGLSDLLDFVRLDHYDSPEPSPLILAFDLPTAAWRFISNYHQHSILERAQSIQFGAASSIPLARKACEGSDASLSPIIQQESNARIDRSAEALHQAFNLANDIQAISRSGPMSCSGASRLTAASSAAIQPSIILFKSHSWCSPSFNFTNWLRQS